MEENNGTSSKTKAVTKTRAVTIVIDPSRATAPTGPPRHPECGSFWSSLQEAQEAQLERTFPQDLRQIAETIAVDDKASGKPKSARQVAEEKLDIVPALRPEDVRMLGLRCGDSGLRQFRNQWTIRNYPVGQVEKLLARCQHETGVKAYVLPPLSVRGQAPLPDGDERPQDYLRDAPFGLGVDAVAGVCGADGVFNRTAFTPFDEFSRHAELELLVAARARMKKGLEEAKGKSGGCAHRTEQHLEASSHSLECRIACLSELAPGSKLGQDPLELELKLKLKLRMREASDEQFRSEHRMKRRRVEDRAVPGTVNVGLIENSYEFGNSEFEGICWQPWFLERLRAARKRPDDASRLAVTHADRSLGLIAAQNRPGYRAPPDAGGKRSLPDQFRGIAPNVAVFAVSPSGGDRDTIAGAVLEAAQHLGPGDVLLLEAQMPGPANGFAINPQQHGYVPVEYRPGEFEAIANLVAKQDIIVIEAAGNGRQNLDAPIYAQLFDRRARDSGAIVVGAGNPPSEKVGPARSAYLTTNCGSRIDVQAWGAEVLSTGANLAVEIDEGLTGHAGPHHVPDFSWYRGTSAAAALVAGVAASLQGMFRSAYLEASKKDAGIEKRRQPYLLPWEMRNLLTATGTPQAHVPGEPFRLIGPQVNLACAADFINVFLKSDESEVQYFLLPDAYGRCHILGFSRHAEAEGTLQVRRYELDRDDRLRFVGRAHPWPAGAAAGVPRPASTGPQPPVSGPFPAVPGPFPAVPGPFPAVPGPFPAVPGPFPAVPGPFPAVPGPFPAVPGPFPAVPGPFPAVPGPFPAVPGPFPAVPGPFPAVPGPAGWWWFE